MEEKESSSSEEEDEELNRVLKISAIFSGDDVGKLDAFLPKNCIAETPPPSKAETEVQKRHNNLTTTESHSSSPTEPAGLSNTSDLASAVDEDLITEEERNEESESFEKPMDEEQSDDDLEEILADEFIDQDSPT